jgi:hypothetical protein
MPTHEQRLRALEDQLQRSRRGQRILAVVMLAIIGMAATGNSPSQEQQGAPAQIHPPVEPARQESDTLKTVQAEQFVVTDAQGRMRARLTISDQGPELSMFDQQGCERLELSHTGSDSSLRFLDAEGTPQVSLALTGGKVVGELELRGPGGRAVSQADGFRVFDTADQPRVYLALLNGNHSVLGISDGHPSGPPSVELTAGEHGSRGVKIHNPAGKALFSVTAEGDGRTHLTMRDPQDDRLLQISAGRAAEDSPEIAFVAPHDGGVTAPLRLGLDFDGQPFMWLAPGRPPAEAPAERQRP